MSQRTVINPASLPMPTLPLSRAVKVGNLVFVSGTPASRNPATGTWDPDIRAQVRGCLEVLQTILKEAGASLKDVVSATTYLKDSRYFEAYNEEYRKFFPTNPPTRTTVEAALMHPDMLIEISCIAVVPG